MADNRAHALRVRRGDSARYFRAPGRVNLLGGHVDYHDGIVAAMAVERDVVVAVTPRSDGQVIVDSLDLDGIVSIAADGTADPTTIVPSWGRLVGGVVRVAAELGRPPVGFDATVATSLTIGGGLSSSAAFEVAVALAAGSVAEWTVDGSTLARACQRAEHIATGVSCGIQDQTMSIAARAGHVTILDCRTMALTYLPMPDGVAVIVLDSAVARTLEATPWPQRRVEGLAVAEQLGLRVLRDATIDQVAHSPRGRHVVSEIERVRAFASAVERGAVTTMGALMTAGHASLRDDMEVSIPELDDLVARFLAHGAYGSRLTGGGFGGCVVALTPSARAEAIASAVAAEYAQRFGRSASWFVSRPAPGAGSVN